MSRKTLPVASDLALPLAFATSRNMVLAQSGAGKSNVCVVLAEELYRAKVPWVAIDTKGDWYGVRSNRSGKQRGLDVPVFGGEFGDMPLSPLAGARMAELVAAGKLQGVLDVSDFPKASDVSKFLTDFATTLLKKQRTPLHLFLEECADYLPQGGFRGQMDPMAAACVGAMKRLATKGRFRGIGYTLISQRAAEVNKTVLYQCETLIALRMVGELDIKWIEGWVRRSSKHANELLETLPDLETGEGWVWSPRKLKITKRVTFRQRETFDSGAEPEIGKARVVPKMAPVELKALRQELADLEEQAKADDPRALRAKIVDLEKQLKAKAPLPSTSQPQLVLKKNEIVVDERDLASRVASAKELSERIKKASAGLEAFSQLLGTLKKNKPAAVTPERQKKGLKAFADFAAKYPPPKPVSGGIGRMRNDTDRDPTIGNSGLSRIMIALAQLHPRTLTRRQLALRAGLAQSGTFDTYLSKARTAQWIEGRSDIAITALGIAALGKYSDLPEGDALFDYWLNEVGKNSGAGRMMSALYIAFPDAMSRADLAQHSDMSLGGTFDTYLSKLRGYEIVEGRSEIKLSKELVG